MQHMLYVSKPLDRILKIPSSAKPDQLFGLSWNWLLGSTIGSGCSQMDQNSDKTQNFTYETQMNTIFVSFFAMRILQRVQPFFTSLEFWDFSMVFPLDM